MRKTLILFACAILCCSFVGAQTTESVCEGEQGAANGLCSAFCDAMDCDSDDPQGSETACNKVKSKYQQITGDEPPCLVPVVTCPCIEELPGFLYVSNQPVLACYDVLTAFLTFKSVPPEGQLVQDVGVFLRNPGCVNQLGDFLSTTLEEALVCADYLRAKAAAAGVPCEVSEPYY
jgi:hypothetical protein